MQQTALPVCLPGSFPLSLAAAVLLLQIVTKTQGRSCAASACPLAGCAVPGVVTSLPHGVAVLPVLQVGEIIGEAGQGQYEVYAAHGRGVFSSVLRARDLARRDHDTGIIPEVAIKVGKGCERAGVGLQWGPAASGVALLHVSVLLWG